MTPTSEEFLALARDLQTEYWGQAERETAPTVQFALREKGNAMGEFIQRVEFKLRGERE